LYGNKVIAKGSPIKNLANNEVYEKFFILPQSGSAIWLDQLSVEIHNTNFV